MTGNLLTLADAYSAVKKYVDNGSCDTTAVYDTIAEAEQRLWNRLSDSAPRLALRRMRVRIQNRCLSLPWEVEKVMWVDIDGVPAHVFGPVYEFLSTGPGDIDIRGPSSSGYKQLVDMGEYPTQFDIPIVLTCSSTSSQICDATPGPAYHVAAFSPYSEDVPTEITLRGLDSNSDEIYTTQDDVWTPGEVITVNRWSGGVEGTIVGQWSDITMTTNEFKQITQVTKSVTKGPVCLYAIDPDTNYMYLLSKMVPNTTIPMYRRYKILNQACTEDCAYILALVKMRFRKATDTTDVLSIQNMSALKNMVRAISVENKGDLTTALGFENNAYRLLLEEKQTRENSGGMPVIIDFERQLTNGRYNRPYAR